MRSKESDHAVLSTAIAGAGRRRFPYDGDGGRPEQFLASRRCHSNNSAPVSQKATPPPLNLSDDQRAKIKQVLATHNTQVTFALKTTQSARGFNPAVGEKLPPSLKTYALPPPLIYQMPKLKRTRI